VSRLAGVALAVVLVVVAVAPAVAVSSGDVTGHTGPATDLAPTARDPADGDTSTDANGTVTIAGVYPNPVADGDRGEFVLLAVPPDTDLGDYRLADEQDSVALPDEVAGGLVAVTWEPAPVRNLTDRRVVAVAGELALANGGERLRLARDNETVATARYREASEGELGRFDPDGTIAWRPVGRTDRPVVTAENGSVRAFVLPDAPGVPLETLRSAQERILLAGYTFTSERVARALERAAERGVDVRVLLEGAPVDGVTRHEARLLDQLVAAGVAVGLLGGAPDQYAFHHAKYAVVDDTALVLTENWKPAGTGGHSSRGWGVVVSQPRVVRGLAATFRADADWAGTRSWTRFKRGRSFATDSVANGTFPRRHDPETVSVERAELLVTPDNGARRVTDVIDNATASVDVVQVTIDGPDQRFLRAAVRAARRGVEVRVLLSGAWYVREDNRRLVERLRERADSEGLPLRARLADPQGQFEKVHAKGMVVDADRVLVGSLNWNGESLRENREVLVLLHGEEVGGYYGQVFEADWERSGPSPPNGALPLGSLAAVAGTVVLAVLVLRRVEFGSGVGVEP